MRGDILDLYIPLYRFPVRVEFFGDEIESLRFFDPETQRSLRGIDEIEISVVRETIRSGEVDLRLGALSLGDRFELPTSRTRQVVDYLQQGMDFFGIEALVPLFHEGMEPLWNCFPADCRWYVDDLEALKTLAGRVEETRRSEHAAALADQRLVSAPEDFFLASAELEKKLDSLPVVGERIDLYDPERADDVPRFVSRCVAIPS